MLEDNAKFCSECGHSEFIIEEPTPSVPVEMESSSLPETANTDDIIQMGKPAEEYTVTEQKKKSKAPVVIFVLIALVIALIIGCVVLMTRLTKKDETTNGIEATRTTVQNDNTEDNDSDNNNEYDQVESTQLPKMSTKETIEQTILVDEDGIKITAQELTFAGNSPRLNLLLENNTEKKLNFTSEYLEQNIFAVNGYMLNEYIDTDITPGNKANESISIDYEDLMLLGIHEVEAIELGFTVYDSDDNVVLTKMPIQIKTSSYKSDDFTQNTFRDTLNDENMLKLLKFKNEYYSENTVYDDGGVTIDTIMVGINGNGEKIVLFEGYNSSTAPVIIAINDIEINDVTVSSGRWTSVVAAGGKHAVDDINIDSVLRWGSSITEPDDIYKIAFTAQILDMDYDGVAEKREIVINLDKKPAKNNSGEIVFDENDFTIKYMGMKDGSYGSGVDFVFQVTNNKNFEIEIETNSISINGFMISVFEFMYIDPGKTGAFAVNLPDWKLKDNNLSKDSLTDAEFDFEISKGFDVLANPTVKLQLTNNTQT